MAKITLRQAAAWCGGHVEEKYADITFLGVNNDSRKLLPGQLFLALQAERDGHDFIPMAMEKGAAAALCSRNCGDYPAIIVEDPRKALGDIARQERLRKVVLSILRMRDSRMSIHDFRVSPGAVTNLIFDVALPTDLLGQEEEIRTALTNTLNDLEEGEYELFITFDPAEFDG